jgi:cytochrome c-type biogenesis protein CcmH
MRRHAAIFFAAAILFAGAPAFAVQPDEVLADPALEQRARDLSAQLRCMVCQNQSIDDSDAELARDLRLLVRERLVAGDSDEEVLAYLVDRYGEFVLLRPAVSARNALLWATPALVLALGAAGVVLFMRRRKTVASDAPLSKEEAARLAEILHKRD